MFEKKINSWAEDLAKPNSYTLTHANLVPPHHRSEATRTEYLREAINGWNWAREVVIETENVEIPNTEVFILFHDAVTAGNAALNQYSNPTCGTVFTNGQQIYSRK